MNTLTSPFSNITEPTTVRRILALEGLSDMADDIVGEGYCFCAYNAGEHWCLAIAHKTAQGRATYRIVTCHKSAGGKCMSDTFSAITLDLCGSRQFLFAKTMSVNQN